MIQILLILCITWLQCTLCTFYFVDPITVITPQRFSVMAKYITAQYWDKNYQTNWANQLYAKHLEVWNNFYEETPKKRSLEDYIQAFKEIIASITIDGFNPQKTIIPIGNNMFITDGEHRIGAALYYQKKIAINYVNYTLPNKNPGYSSEFFKIKKLDEKYLDHMALEYAKLKKNCYIVILFPVMGTQRKSAYDLLNQHGQIVYSKKVTLSENGAVNLIRHLYELENFTYFWSFDFTGVKAEAQLRFLSQKDSSVEIILWESADLAINKLCKEAIRNIYNNRYVIHINDTHIQTIYHAQVLFNNNSVHFLNYAKPKNFTQFTRLMTWYKNWLDTNTYYKQEHFCIDSSAVLSAYGIRDCADLDFLHIGYPELLHKTGHELVSSHNHPHELALHAYHVDDIIVNPDHYFYYKGLKFASLETIIRMKQKRNEKKDQQDINLIQDFLRQ
jgi:hypothetical protein